MPGMAQADSLELGKLRWRCRRGMKELDVLLTRYVEEQYGGAPRAHQEAFRALLDAPDPVIYAYCLGRERPPTDLLSSLIERITRGSLREALAASARLLESDLCAKSRLQLTHYGNCRTFPRRVGLSRQAGL